MLLGRGRACIDQVQYQEPHKLKTSMIYLTGEDSRFCWWPPFANTSMPLFCTHTHTLCLEAAKDDEVSWAWLCTYQIKSPLRWEPLHPSQSRLTVIVSCAGCAASCSDPHRSNLAKRLLRCLDQGRSIEPAREGSAAGHSAILAVALPASPSVSQPLPEAPGPDFPVMFRWLLI